MPENKEHRDHDHDDRDDFYEMRRRMHSLRDRDYRTNNKSGCMISALMVPFILVVIFSLIFGF